MALSGPHARGRQCPLPGVKRTSQLFLSEVAFGDAAKVEYLAKIEALAASDDRDLIRFERAALARLTNDACLPEAVNERAARLLSQIG